MGMTFTKTNLLLLYIGTAKFFLRESSHVLSMYFAQLTARKSNILRYVFCVIYYKALKIVYKSVWGNKRQNVLQKLCQRECRALCVCPREM